MVIPKGKGTNQDIDNELLRTLISLEVNVDNWNKFHNELNEIVEVTEFPHINLKDETSCTDVLKEHLERQPDSIEIFSGTLNSRVFENQENLDKLEERLYHGKLKLVVFAGPYIMNGKNNKFIQLIEKAISDSKKVSFYLSKDRLPVHCVFSDSLFTYESAHAEYLAIRRRYRFDGISDSTKMAMIWELLHSVEGRFSNYIDAKMENNTDGIRKFIVSAAKDFTARLAKTKRRKRSQKLQNELNSIKKKYSFLLKA